MINLKWKKVLSILLVLALLVTLAGCAKKDADNKGEAPADKEKPTLILADAGWDSIRFHNSVAQTIIENGYGYKTDVMVGSSPMTLQGLINGDIDIYMELWTTNYGDKYYDAVKNGDIVELGINYDDNAQGLYVPTYMIKGDPKRGIEATAPDLKSVKDLPKYWELFKDPEEPSKGRILGAIPGWVADEIMRSKVEKYGLDKTYNYFSPGSDTALSSTMAKAYEEGKPWLGYYWEPTWVMGLFDMTLLEDAPYSDELWNDGYQCEIPAVPLTVAVHRDMSEKAADVVEFLKNYHTSSALTSEALAYMQKNEASVEEAAKWFLKEHEEIWTKWVSAEVAEKVKKAVE